MNADLESSGKRSIFTKYRRSIRLHGFDYGQPGAYFVTVCTRDRACLFGEVVEGEMVLNAFGAIVQECWQDLPNHYPHVGLYEFVVMPNHVHGIIPLTGETVGAGLRPAPTTDVVSRRHGLPEVVRAFKTFSARRVNELRRHPFASLWQRGYYEHVIRNERDLERIREYIVGNPVNWTKDEYCPGVA